MGTLHLDSRDRYDADFTVGLTEVADFARNYVSDPGGSALALRLTRLIVAREYRDPYRGNKHPMHWHDTIYAPLPPYRGERREGKAINGPRAIIPTSLTLAFSNIASLDLRVPQGDQNIVNCRLDLTTAAGHVVNKLSGYHYRSIPALAALRQDVLEPGHHSSDQRDRWNGYRTTSLDLNPETHIFNGFIHGLAYVDQGTTSHTY